MGWQGNVLRVNLTRGEIIREPLNMEWAETYIGQRGLGSKYLTEEVDPMVDALAPENNLIFATGPLTASGASTGGRYSVITKGALTNAIACSNSGGQFGAFLKLAGWDMLLLEGKSPEPVYLLIENDKIEIVIVIDGVFRVVYVVAQPVLNAKPAAPTSQRRGLEIIADPRI